MLSPTPLPELALPLLKAQRTKRDETPPTPTALAPLLLPALLASKMMLVASNGHAVLTTAPAVLELDRLIVTCPRPPCPIHTSGALIVAPS